MDWVMLSLLSAIFLAVSNIFSKKLLGKGDWIFVAFTFSSVITIGSLLFAKNIAFIPSPRIYFLIFLKAVVMISAWLFGLKAMQLLPINLFEPTSVLRFPVLLVLSIFFLGERITISQLSGIFLMILASFALKGNILELNKKNSELLFVIGGTLLVGALSAFLSKVVTPIAGYPTTIFHSFFLLSIFYGSAIIFKGKLNQFKSFFSTNQNILIITGILIFIRDVFYFMAVEIPIAPISLIIPLKYSGKIFSAFLGGKYFKEKGVLRGTAIAVLTVLAVYLMGR